MKNYWKIFGLVTLVAGVLYYPAMKLYHYLTRQPSERETADGILHIREFRPAYRGMHHLPEPSHNGDGNA